MKLYLYKIGTAAPVMAFDNAISYSDSRVMTEERTADGSSTIVYGPFAENCELSSLPDCSEALFSKWREDHPTQEERLSAIESAIERGMSL